MKVGLRELMARLLQKVSRDFIEELDHEESWSIEGLSTATPMYTVRSLILKCCHNPISSFYTVKTPVQE
jgi:hypothetical protein